MLSTRSRPPWAAGGILLNSIEGSVWACRGRQPNISEQMTTTAILIRLKPLVVRVVHDLTRR
jgi:hypothetical protein